MEKRDRAHSILWLILVVVYGLMGTHKIIKGAYIEMAVDFFFSFLSLAFFIVAEVKSIVEFYSKKK